MSLPAKIEALLFAAAEPLSVSRMSKICEAKKSDAQAALSLLESKYRTDADAGLALIKIEDNYQLLTNPRWSAAVGRYLKSARDFELTAPALETLAVIAYRGPVTKPEIEQVRGVNCALILRNLLLRALIEKEDSGGDLPRFRITHEFLRFLGVNKVEDLPNYSELSRDKTLAQILDTAQEFSSL